MKKLTHLEYINRLPVDIKNNFKIIDFYKNSKTKIIIEDNIGIQYKVNPGELLKNQTPTIRMAIDKTDAISKQISFKYGNEYKLLSKYDGDKSNLIIEDNFGIKYRITPNSLKSKNKTRITLNNALDINKAVEIKLKYKHCDFYKYKDIKYTNNETPLTIVCPIHGEFVQSFHSHYSGSGCPICSNIKDGNKIMGFKKKQWINFYLNNENRPKPIVYIIQCYDNNENFIKIGRTYKLIHKRFGNGLTKALPYNYNILCTIAGDPEFIFNLENKLHNDFKNFKYSPSKYFGGNTECFSLDILDTIKNIKHD